MSKVIFGHEKAKCDVPKPPEGDWSHIEEYSLFEI